MSDGQRPLVGITLGDPAGVGPEISLQALREAAVYEKTRPVVIGDRMVVEKAAKAGAVPPPAYLRAMSGSRCQVVMPAPSGGPAVRASCGS